MINSARNPILETIVVSSYTISFVPSGTQKIAALIKDKDNNTYFLQKICDKNNRVLSNKEISEIISGASPKQIEVVLQEGSSSLLLSVVQPEEKKAKKLINKADEIVKDVKKDANNLFQYQDALIIYKDAFGIMKQNNQNTEKIEKKINQLHNFIIQLAKDRQINSAQKQCLNIMKILKVQVKKFFSSVYFFDEKEAVNWVSSQINNVNQEKVKLLVRALNCDFFALHIASKYIQRNQNWHGITEYLNLLWEFNHTHYLSNDLYDSFEYRTALYFAKQALEKFYSLFFDKSIISPDEYFQIAKDLLKRSKDLLKRLKRSSEFLLDSQDREKAFAISRVALQIAESFCCHSDVASIILELFEIIRRLFSSNHIRKAYKLINKVLEIYQSLGLETIDDDNFIKLAKIAEHLRFGGKCLIKSDIFKKEAVKFLKEALKTYQYCSKNCDKSNLFITLAIPDVLFDIGCSLQSCGDHKEAVDFFKQALAAGYQELPSCPPRTMGAVLFRIGFSLQSCGNHEEAVDFFKQALAWYQELPSCPPHTIGGVLFRIGCSLKSCDNHEEAVDFFKQALEKCQQLPEDTQVFKAKILSLIEDCSKSLKKHAEMIEHDNETEQVSSSTQEKHREESEIDDSLVITTYSYKRKTRTENPIFGVSKKRIKRFNMF